MTEEMKRNSITFNNVQEANLWLQKQDLIVITKFNVQAGGIGLFKSADDARVLLEYETSDRPVGYKYGIYANNESEFFHESDLEGCKKKWIEDNPKLELLAMRRLTGSVGSVSSLVIGFGEKVSFHRIYVLFRQKGLIGSDMKQYCRYCGTKIGEGIQFCWNCGKKLD